MLAEQRQEEIVRLLNREGGVRVAALARRFSVTEETIRRDLNQLADAGRIRRSHGGAVPVERGDYEVPYWQRETQHQLEKAMIAREAIHRIKDGDSLILDASTTAWHMAKCMPDRSIRVVTPSVRIALVLARLPKAEVVIVGGMLSPTSLSAVGPNAEDMLRRYQVKKAFVSCRGVDLARGISDASDGQASLRRVMIDQADTSYLLADYSKFDVRSLSVVCPIERFHEVLTDTQTPSDVVRDLKARGIRVTLVAVDRATQAQQNDA